MTFLILDTEIEEKTLYAIGKIDESEISNPNIPGFPFEFLSIFIIIGVFLILKKKSFMTVKKK